MLVEVSVEHIMSYKRSPGSSVDISVDMLRLPSLVVKADGEGLWSSQAVGLGVLSYVIEDPTHHSKSHGTIRK